MFKKEKEHTLVMNENTGNLSLKKNKKLQKKNFKVGKSLHFKIHWIKTEYEEKKVNLNPEISKLM